MFAKNFFVSLSLAAADFIVIFFSLCLGFFVRYLFETDFNALAAIKLMTGVMWFSALMGSILSFVFYAEGLYKKHIAFWDETKEIVRGIAITVVLFLSLAALFKLEHSVSRIGLLCGITIVAFLLPIFKLYAKITLFKMGIWGESAIIIGDEQKSRELSQKLHSDPYLGYRVLQTIKSVDELERLEQQIAKSVIVCDKLSPQNILKLQKFYKNIILSPDIDGIALLNTEFSYSFEERTFFLTIKNNLKSDANIFIKRILDISISLLLLPIFVLITLSIAIAIKLDSHGPVFFRQKRIGEGGKEFYIIKFRSMYQDATERLEAILREDMATKAEWEQNFKLKNDPRITKVGRFLRKTSLDELPQLINVFMGEMSLVGPRPVIKEELDEYYRESGSFYTEVKPGITGLWQVEGRSDTTYEERVRLDLWYITNWSVWLDIVILLKTIKVVLLRKGAY